jgi:hypothetical protein
MSQQGHDPHQRSIESNLWALPRPSADGPREHAQEPFGPLANPEARMEKPQQPETAETSNGRIRVVLFHERQ